jgi:3-oxoacyl-[acyl-carrier protein] reductase
VETGIAGRVALVSGASAGIGRAIAAALVAEGARVAVASRSRDRIEAAAAEIGASAYVFDTGDVDAAGGLVRRVEAELGEVEILVTNTGGPPARADALAFSRDEWETAYRQLVLTPLALVTAVVPAMRARRWGRIVNVSSFVVREPRANLMLSNAHRSATLAAFKTVARQVAGDGVTVNTILPGSIGTDRAFQLAGSREEAERAAARDVPAGRMGTPDEIAAVAVFLCSAPASYLTGVALLVDGGATHLV